MLQSLLVVKIVTATAEFELYLENITNYKVGQHEKFGLAFETITTVSYFNLIF